MTAALPGLVVSGWSAVSPFGIGRAEFISGLAAGHTAVSPVDRALFGGPYERAALVPDFSAAGQLGKKGTRLMDRLTAIAVSTFGQLLVECGADVVGEPERVALVLGTGSGSVQSIMDFTRDSLVGDKPYHVDPARFPNTVMNRAAGQSAIWHGIKGPNTTVAGGWLSGLLALSYSTRLYRAGRCRRVLCGAAEEYSEARAWLEWAGRGQDDAVPLGEGGAAVLLESAPDARDAGRPALARLLATGFGAFATVAQGRAVLADRIRRALDTAGAAPERVRLVAPLDAPGELADMESGAVADALGGFDGQWVRCWPRLGDTSAAATGFQLASVLASAALGAIGPGELALVTGADRDGTVGCAVLEVRRP